MYRVIKIVSVIFYCLSYSGPIFSTSSKNSHIIGPGNTRTPKGFPFIVSIEKNGRHSCGGTILNSWMILTAAHCLKEPAESYRIRAGSLYRGRDGHVINAATYIKHPDFAKNKFGAFDVGIIVFRKPLLLIDELIEPTLLPSQNFTLPANDNAIVFGWGRIKENGTSSKWLRNVTVPIQDQETCDKVNNFNMSSIALLCAGNLKYGGIGSCIGDSGGPLIHQSTRIQIGIVSSGIGCARPGKPGLYTNVMSVRNWINKIVVHFYLYYFKAKGKPLQLFHGTQPWKSVSL